MVCVSFFFRFSCFTFFECAGTPSAKSREAFKSDAVSGAVSSAVASTDDEMEEPHAVDSAATPSSDELEEADNSPTSGAEEQEEEEAPPDATSAQEEQEAAVEQSEEEDDKQPQRKRITRGAITDEEEDADTASSSSSSSSDSDSETESPRPVSNKKGKTASKAKAPQTPSGSKKKGNTQTNPSSAGPVPSGSPQRATKVWHEPVSGRGATAGVVAGSRAPSFNIKVLCISDMGNAINRGSRVPHIKTLAYNLDNDEPMLIVAYGPEAIKYQAELLSDRCYTVQLEGTPVPEDKPCALPNAKFVYRIARGTTVRAYEVKDAAEDLEAKYADKRAADLCTSIDVLKHADTKSLVHLCGIVMEVQHVSTKSSMGMKVTVADEKGYVKVMFFEARPGLKRGDSLLLLGATIWINTMTKAKEVSVYSSTFVATNAASVRISDALRKIERKLNYKKLQNVSAVPCGPVMTMIDVMAAAHRLEAGENGTITPVSATVNLFLDPEQPSSGNFWYNGCNTCMKKMARTGEKDENGDEVYAHEVDGAHRSTSYTEHFLFNGRFKDPSDALGVYRYQVNDVLGVRLFGCTAEEFQMLTQQQREATLKGAMSTHKFNITVGQDQQIASMVMV
jgi:hypothetical protein